MRKGDSIAIAVIVGLEIGLSVAFMASGNPGPAVFLLTLALIGVCVMPIPKGQKK